MSERGEVVAWLFVRDNEAWTETSIGFDADTAKAEEESGGVVTPLVRQSDYLALREELDIAKEEIADLLKAIDDNWVQHQRVVKAEAELAALKARIAGARLTTIESDGWIEEKFAPEFVGDRVRLLLEES